MSLNRVHSKFLLSSSIIIIIFQALFLTQDIYQYTIQSKLTVYMCMYIRLSYICTNFDCKVAEESYRRFFLLYERVYYVPRLALFFSKAYWVYFGPSYTPSLFAFFFFGGYIIYTIYFFFFLGVNVCRFSWCIKFSICVHWNPDDTDKIFLRYCFACFS